MDNNIWYAMILGVIAGLIPVFLGLLPWGAIKRSGIVTRSLLISFSIGVLIFLFGDVFNQAQEGVAIVGLGTGVALLLTGFITGLLGLAVYEILRGNHNARKGYHPERIEVGQKENGTSNLSIAFAYRIALGIGLHNLGEGLAIGSAYAAGDVTLSFMLIIGFALHNGTEGFGIVASIPKDKGKLKDILLLGLIAGFPTAIGSMIGSVLFSAALSVLFFSLAAGAILYVVVELIPISYTKQHRHLILVGITLGIVIMYVTDLLLSV